jgi:hypothetical protein
MNVHKWKTPVLNYAQILRKGFFNIRREFEIGDVALLRETFGANKACTGRAEIFRVTSIVNGVTNFTLVLAE